MFLIVGLGNPGEKYKNNRHNVGHFFVDYLIQQLKGSKVKRLLITKTDCFMNQSGSFIKKKLSNLSTFQLSNLIIIHDDLDIPLGKFRIDFARGPKLHNGIESIEMTLGTKDFWRVRIGVDNRQQTGQMDGETYVLSDFLPEEKETIISIFPKILSRLQKDFSL